MVGQGWTRLTGWTRFSSRKHTFFKKNKKKMKNSSILIILFIVSILAAIYEINRVDNPMLNFLLPMSSGVIGAIMVVSVIGFKAESKYRELTDKQATDRYLDNYPL